MPRSHVDNRYRHSQPLGHPVGGGPSYRTAIVPTGGVSALSYLDTASGAPTELQRFDYDELTTRRELLNRKMNELRIAEERRLLQRKELTVVHKSAMERVAERRKQNDAFARERNRKFLEQFDDAIARLDGEPARRGPQANHSHSAKADLNRALGGFYQGVAEQRAEYEAQLERWRMDEIRELERQKELAEQRRAVSKLAFEKERAVNAAVARHKQELAIAEVKEQGEVLERHILRQEEEKENALVQQAIEEAARNTLSELHQKELACLGAGLPLSSTPGVPAAGAAAAAGDADRQAQVLQEFVKRNFGSLLKQHRKQQRQTQAQRQQQQPPLHSEATADILRALAESVEATSALANEAQRQASNTPVKRGASTAHDGPLAGAISHSSPKPQTSPGQRVNRETSPGRNLDAVPDHEEDTTVANAHAQLSEGMRTVQELSNMLSETEELLSDNNELIPDDDTEHQRIKAHGDDSPWDAAVASAAAAGKSLQQQQMMTRQCMENSAKFEKSSILAELEALELQQQKLRAQISATHNIPGGWASTHGNATHSANSSPLLLQERPLTERDLVGEPHSMGLTQNAIDLLNRVGSMHRNDPIPRLQAQRSAPPINPRRSLGERLTDGVTTSRADPQKALFRDAYQYTTATDWTTDDSDSFTDATLFDGSPQPGRRSSSATDFSADLELSADHLVSKLAKLSQELVALHGGHPAGRELSADRDRDVHDESLHYDDSFDGSQVKPTGEDAKGSGKSKLGADAGRHAVGSLRQIDDALNGNSQLLHERTSPAQPYRKPQQPQPYQRVGNSHALQRPYTPPHEGSGGRHAAIEENNNLNTNSEHRSRSVGGDGHSTNNTGNAGRHSRESLGVDGDALPPAGTRLDDGPASHQLNHHADSKDLEEQSNALHQSSAAPDQQMREPETQVILDDDNQDIAESSFNDHAQHNTEDADEDFDDDFEGDAESVLTNIAADVLSEQAKLVSSAGAADGADDVQSVDEDDDFDSDYF
eukprot:INCI16206.1.p4 GENE.INCI16206.1~~INCI16206.1.p4  ORF type:complete len:999 (-),score=214.85 INCI16206.1:6778-9774(-)